MFLCFRRRNSNPQAEQAGARCLQVGAGMQDRGSTASFTAFQEKSSELRWEETQDSWLQNMQTPYVSAERGMLTEQLSTMGLRKPIQAIFLDVHQRQPQWGRAGFEAQPCCAHMLSSLGWSSQRFLVLGAAWKVGTDGSCSTLGTAINYQLIRCFPIDSCTTAGRNSDFQFYKQKMGSGHTFGKSSNDS